MSALIISLVNKKSSEISVDSKYLAKDFYRWLRFGIPDLLNNLLSCNGFTNKIESIVKLKYPKRMLEYYFSLGYGILECN